MRKKKSRKILFFFSISWKKACKERKFFSPNAGDSTGYVLKYVLFPDIFMNFIKIYGIPLLCLTT